MFDIIEFITRIFKKEKEDGSQKDAKERLRLVLISDRASVSPHLMESLREELVEVISRYMTIDSNQMVMGLERQGKSMALAATIPVVSIRRKNSKDSHSQDEVEKEKPRESAPKREPVVKKAVEVKEQETTKSAEVKEREMVKKPEVKETREKREVRKAKTEEKPAVEVEPEIEDIEQESEDGACRRRARRSSRRSTASPRTRSTSRRTSRRRVTV